MGPCTSLGLAAVAAVAAVAGAAWGDGGDPAATAGARATAPSPAAPAADAASRRDEPRPGRDRDWHIGVNLRTDVGVHPVRIDGGVRVGAVDAIAVVDPLYLTDGELAVDALVRWQPGSGWGVAAGWRTVVVAVAGGSRYHQHVLVGATAALPWLTGGVCAQWGVELAVVAVRHGADLGTAVLPLDGRVLDLVQPGMFVRFELARGW